LELWKKTSLLQLGIFSSNWKILYYSPQKQDDRTFKLGLLMDGGKFFPIIDSHADTGSSSNALTRKSYGAKRSTLIEAGNFTKAFVQSAPDTHLVGASFMITWNEWCEI